MSNSKVDAAFHGDQSARDRAYGLSTSAPGSRAETPDTEHLAQPGPDYWSFRCLRCGLPVEDHSSLLALLWAWARRTWGRRR